MSWFQRLLATLLALAMMGVMSAGRWVGWYPAGR